MSRRASLLCLLLAACGSGEGAPDLGANPDLAAVVFDAAGCTPGDPTCDPACAGGVEPASCVEGQGCLPSGQLFCGSCGQAGKTCNWPTGDLYCGFDLYWHPLGVAACDADGGTASPDL